MENSMAFPLTRPAAHKKQLMLVLFLCPCLLMQQACSMFTGMTRHDQVEAADHAAPRSVQGKKTERPEVLPGQYGQTTKPAVDMNAGTFVPQQHPIGWHRCRPHEVVTAGCQEDDHGTVAWYQISLPGKYPLQAMAALRPGESGVVNLLSPVMLPPQVCQACSQGLGYAGNAFIARSAHAPDSVHLSVHAIVVNEVSVAWMPKGNGERAVEPSMAQAVSAFTYEGNVLLPSGHRACLENNAFVGPPPPPREDRQTSSCNPAQAVIERQ